jgi:PAS domain-containing protein
VAVLLDITEQKRAEETVRARRALEEEVARIASSVPGVVHSFRRLPDGTMTLPFATAAVEDALGLSREELACDVSGWHGRVEPEDRRRMDAHVAESARVMSPLQEVFRYHHPIKGLRWLEVSSEPVADPGGAVVWHGYMADVTDHRTAVEALQRSEERFRALIENSSDIVVVLDADQHLSFWSPSAAEQLGWTDRVQAERDLRALLHPDRSARRSCSAPRSPPPAPPSASRDASFTAASRGWWR